MTSCQVLPNRISVLLPLLRGLVSNLSIRDRLPQIEVACGDDVDVLVLRILQPLSAVDENILREFADRHRVVLYLQTGGPESARAFHPVPAPDVAYGLPAFGLRMTFGPTEFTQVNAVVNRVLVTRAVALLGAKAGERVGDMFCGLGNFSLAIARGGAQVVGFEGTATLVSRATQNADANDLARWCRFVRADLFKHAEQTLLAEGPFDRMLIDPPRDGAIEVIKALRDPLPERLVYVSCNPGTLARDSGMLVQVLGYRLEAAGVVNMFPHTAHVESIAVFQR